jgi:uncharacterized protein involved in exopolysaccharide biosynthesis
MKTRRLALTGLILILVGILFAVAGLFMLVQRDQFRAMTRLVVESQGDYGPYFIQTEFKIIQSEAVLNKVVAALNLNEAWGRKFNHGKGLSDAEAMRIIKKKLDLRLVQNTRFLQIRVTDDDPGEAARLANAIAANYRDYKREEYHLLRERGIASFKVQLKESEEKARNAKAEMERLRAGLKISDITVASNDPAAVPYFEAGRAYENFLRLQKILTAHLDKISDDPVPYIPVSIMDPAVPPNRPISPNRRLATIMIAFGVLLMIGGIVCLRAPTRESGDLERRF